MSEAKRTLNLNDLLSLGTSETHEVELPAASEKLGESVAVKIRALEPTELLEAADMPLGDVMEIAEKNGEITPEEGTALYREHVKAFDAEDMIRMMVSVVRTATVEPKFESDEGVKALRGDLPVVFKAIMNLTVPRGAAEKAGEFRRDG